MGSEPAPSLAKVTPAAGYADAPLALSIAGGNFRPTYVIDARTAASSIEAGGFRATLTPNPPTGAAIELQNVMWQSLGLLAAQLPAGAPPGWYDLTVRDPRGRSSTAARAFQSLGDDTTAPVVRIRSPLSGSSFAVGASVPIVVVADDGMGTIAALDVTMSSGSGAEQIYHCSVTGEGNVSCAFTLPAPGTANNPDMLTIHASATDGAGLVGDARAQFGLVRAPTFNSLSPARGTTRGGTLVHIEAGGLTSGLPEVRFDGFVATLAGISTTAVDVLTPVHALAVPVPVTLTIAGVTVRKEGGFTYVAPPLVRTILPASGPAAGGFHVTVIGDNFALGTTQIFLGTAPLRCVQYSNANRIDGLAPPGTGTQAVLADDAVAGSVPGATVPFQYLQDGGVGPVDGFPPQPDAGPAYPDPGASGAMADDAGCPRAP
ncbi:MAG: IPT/TIG domain-containing protein [Haliangium ochraceum]